MRKFPIVILMLVAIGLSSAIQSELDRRRSGPIAGDDPMLPRSGEELARFSFGFNSLLADLFWVRTVIYFGGRLEEQRTTGDRFTLDNMPLLAPLLRATTEIDPHHIAAYRFGAFFLAYRDFDQAVEFTRRGIERNPEDWRLYQDLGMIYWRAGRFREASQAYSVGAELPGAPAWMKGISATMAARGGDIETARELFTRLYEESRDENIRRFCLEQLERIERESAMPRR